MRGRRVGEAIFALAVLALAAFIAVETARLPTVATYARVGPKLFPWLVAASLGLIGVVLLFQAARSPAPAEPPPALDWPPLVWITGGLAAQMLLIEPAGFVIASAVLFVAVAWAFGERRLVRTAPIGLILGAAVYVGFTRGLGLTLPAGALGALW